MSSAGTQLVEVEGRELKLSHLEKVLYPEAEFRKAQVIDYYTRIAPVLLPHLEGRPLTLKRYPEGVQGEFFYEKNCPKYRPSWFQTVTVYSEGRQADMQYCEVGDLASLIWIANLATLELHTSLSRAKALARPTALAFDLDPGPPADVLTCAEVAFWIRDLFERFGLQCFPKTSGSKGLQLYLPLNGPTSYEETKSFAHAVAQLLEREHPDRVTSEMKKALRPGKIFIDWSQNDEHKTTVNVYSLRARERPTVSTPVTWEELEKAVRAGDAKQLVFEADEVLRRVQKQGDLFAPVLKLKQQLPKLTGGEAPKARRNPSRPT